MLALVLKSYGWDSKEWNIQPFGTGLINHTWLIKKESDEYIVQRINHNVFRDPSAISNNIRSVGHYLHKHFPDYLFVTPINSVDNRDIIQTSEGYFRVFPFVRNSVTYMTVENPELAFEAAKQFGKFTHLLSGYDENQLQETIPNFHNLTLRFKQFEESLNHGNKERLSKAADLIKQLEKRSSIVDEFELIKTNRKFKKRVVHHDTKISNVLFDKQNKGLCVIDLDTVMSGFFISDVGDMMRTYLAAESEEATDFAKIEVREDYFVAIVDGYLSEMKTDLTEEEQKAFTYAGKFMIYMQSIRFLADFLMNDMYYGSKYEGQNFNRAINQLHLLESLEEKEEKLLQKIKRKQYFFSKSN